MRIIINSSRLPHSSHLKQACLKRRAKVMREEEKIEKEIQQKR